MQTLNIQLPRTDKTVPVNVDNLPQMVQRRLIELGLTGLLRSSVNSAFSTELAKAEADYNEANKGKKNAKPFDKEAFTSALNPIDVATAKVAELEAGTIRQARGQSASQKLLARLVKNNVIGALMAKGKKAKEAGAMVGEDVFAFIERTARKRAGDDAEAFKLEMAKLDAQYVAPARALVSPDEDEADDAAEGATEDAATEGADELV